MKYTVLFLLFVLSACASSPSKKAFEKPLITKATKDGKSHYFLGTIHLPIDVEKMYPQLLPLIDESAVFVSEVSIEELERSGTKQWKVENNYYKQGEGSLKSDLSPEAYAMVVDDLYFVSSDTFKTLKPARALELIEERKDKFQTHSLASTEPMILKMSEGLGNMGISIRKDGAFYDAQLESYARSKKKQLVTLDEPGLYGKCSQAKAVYQLESLAFEQKKTSSDNYVKVADNKQSDCFIGERNKAWLAKLKPLLEKGDQTFVAVGMLHLTGTSEEDPNGLMNLIKKEGYQIELIK